MAVLAHLRQLLVHQLKEQVAAAAVAVLLQVLHLAAVELAQEVGPQVALMVLPILAVAAVALLLTVDQIPLAEAVEAVC